MAACWYGGARGLARPLLAGARDRDVGPHAYAHPAGFGYHLTTLGGTGSLAGAQ